MRPYTIKAFKINNMRERIKEFGTSFKNNFFYIIIKKNYFILNI